MKLLFFNHNMAWSGTFFRAFHLGRELVKLGHEVTIVTTSPSARAAARRETRDGTQLIEMPDLFWGRGRTGWDPWNTMQRILGLVSSDFDAVHAFDCRPAVILPALYHARKADLPLFVDWADWWGRGGSIGEREGGLINLLIGPVETWFEEAFRNQATGTTVISRALERRAQSLGVPSETILRFPQCCNLAVVPGQRAAARARLGVPAEAPLLLHVGQIYPSDYRLLHEAFLEVLRQRPEVRLVMVGKTRTPIPVNSVPGGALHSTGYVARDTLQDWLAAASACALPLQDSVSARGRWPSKVNDYLSAGRAVVMPLVSDAADYVREAGAGWTCAPDADSYATALLSALESQSHADLAGAHGRRLAESELSWARASREVNAFYQKLMRSATIDVAAPVATGPRTP